MRGAAVALACACAWALVAANEDDVDVEQAVANEPLVDVSSYIQGRVFVPSKLKKKDPVNVLVNGQHATYARQNGTFLLSLAPGSHIVDFSLRGLMYPQIRIDVSRKTPGRYKAMLNDRDRTSLHEPLEVEPLGQVQYFDQHEPINWMGFLKQPMVLMMLFGLGMAYLMQELQKSEEFGEIMKEAQKAGSPQEALAAAARGEVGQPQARRPAPKAAKK